MKNQPNDVPSRYMGMGMLNIAITASRVGFSHNEWMDMADHVWKSLQSVSIEEIMNPRDPNEEDPSSFQ